MLQVFSAGEVVKADQQRRARGPQFVAEGGQLRRPGLLGRLDLQIDELAAGLGSLLQHIQLRLQRPREAAAKLLAPAGRDSRCVAMACKEILHFGQRGQWLGARIQPEFKKPGIGQRGLRPLNQFRRRCALNGHAQLAHAQPGNKRRGRGIRRTGAGRRHLPIAASYSGLCQYATAKRSQRIYLLEGWFAQASEPV